MYEYDLGNRLTKLTNHINDTNTMTFDYSTYDKVGNRKSCKIDDDPAQAYTYDELYRLIYVDYNDGDTANYYYDSRGNRTEVTNGSTVYYYSNALNQYTSVGVPEYSYDANGNLADDDTHKYYYDCENRLIEVKNQNNQWVASYRYDYLGRRVKKAVTGATQRYCYDGDQEIAMYGENGTLYRKYIYGPGIDEPICMIDVAAGNKIYYYHFDGLGSVVALSNNVGEIKISYTYDAFGYPYVLFSSFPQEYRFTGRKYDSETGLYYYRSRYYSPYIGRFLQPDPIRYRAGLNLYTYCRNNPINWTDPWGLFYWPPHNEMIRKAMWPSFDFDDINKAIEGHEYIDRGKDIATQREDLDYDLRHSKLWDYLSDAVELGRGGAKKCAAENLGKALHCLEDLFAPHDGTIYGDPDSPLYNPVGYQNALDASIDLVALYNELVYPWYLGPLW